MALRHGDMPALRHAQTFIGGFLSYVDGAIFYIDWSGQIWYGQSCCR